MKEKVLMVTLATLPSAASHVFPGPSAPAGQRMDFISPNCESLEEGEALTSALLRGMGTRDDENGVAPAENGTFGLLEPVRFPPLPWKEARKEPATKTLEPDELEVMEDTWAPAPDTPEKGAFDHEPAFGSQTAMFAPGEEKAPPAQTLVCFGSHQSVSTRPFGPPEPKEVNLLVALS